MQESHSGRIKGVDAYSVDPSISLTVSAGAEDGLLILQWLA